MIHAVVMDFDDTLCLTQAAAFNLENETLHRLGRRPMSAEIHRRTYGRHLFDVITERSPGVDVQAFRRLFPEVLEEFIQAGKLDVIAPENYAVLDELIRAGKQLFILTGRGELEVAHLLAKNHPLVTRITGFYHHDSTRYHKPDPRVFDELLAEHNLQPADCVYVGDSISDAQAADGAGLKCIVNLESGLRRKQKFAGLRVDGFIYKFADLYDAVDKL